MRLGPAPPSLIKRTNEYGRCVAVYHLGSLLGTGGISRVYSVKNPMGPDYACKCINKETLKDSKHLQRCIELECEWHKRLDHPNITKFIESWSDDEFTYIFLEKCSGKTLYSYVMRNKRLLPSEAAVIFRQIILACKYMHTEHGVVHRDIILNPKIS